MKKTDEYFYQALTHLKSQGILPTAAAYWTEKELREKAGFTDNMVEGWHSVFMQSRQSHLGQAMLKHARE